MPFLNQTYKVVSNNVLMVCGPLAYLFSTSLWQVEAEHGGILGAEFCMGAWMRTDNSPYKILTPVF